MPLDPQARNLIDLIDQAGGFSLTPESDPQQLRDLYAGLTVPVTIVVDRVEDRSIPGPAGEIPVRIYRPEGGAPKPIVVYYHGGGWVIGGLETHDHGCRALANSADAVVVSVDYRLAPEYRFPAPLDDARAALGWVAEHTEELGGDASRIAVAGDSAGGNLAAVVAQMARDAGGPALCFQLLIYPVTDHEFDSVSMRDNAEGYFLTRDAMRWFYSHYLDEPTLGADPRVSPIRADDLSGLPPAFVITAEYDPLRDQGVAYAAAMSDAGTAVEARTYAGMFHGFLSMVEYIDAGKVAFDDAVTALRAAFRTG
ncbi:MAG TPA: alpha/beta hydrolase [Acidimicrobiia bacterium]